MKYPSLVLKQFCNRSITVKIETSLNEDGYNETKTYNNIKCNYQSIAKTSYTNLKQSVDIVAKCYIPNDPLYDIENLRGGKVISNGIEYNIEQGTKARNPDDSVNYVLLELS